APRLVLGRGCHDCRCLSRDVVSAGWRGPTSSRKSCKNMPSSAPNPPERAACVPLAARGGYFSYNNSSELLPTYAGGADPTSRAAIVGFRLREISARLTLPLQPRGRPRLAPRSRSVATKSASRRSCRVPGSPFDVLHAALHLALGFVHAALALEPLVARQHPDRFLDPALDLVDDLAHRFSPRSLSLEGSCRWKTLESSPAPPGKPGSGDRADEPRATVWRVTG